MLAYALTHPLLLGALARAGHGSKVLVADGNYPVATAVATGARVIYLNLSPGTVEARSVIAAVLSAVPVEAAEVMSPGDGSTPPIFDSFTALLGPDGPPLTRLSRTDFYIAARDHDVAVVVATGEQALFANLLLTIGVVQTPPPQ